MVEGIPERNLKNSNKKRFEGFSDYNGIYLKEMTNKSAACLLLGSFSIDDVDGKTP